MRDILLDLFGAYTVPTYEDCVISSSGAITYIDKIPNGISGVDIVWVSGVLLFALTLYCVFKIIGGLLKNA